MRPLSDPALIEAAETWDVGGGLGEREVVEVVREVPPRRIENQQAIQEAFEQFHAANPEVYRTLVRLARDYRARVGTTPGIGMLWEVMRWTLAIETRRPDVYKLNNNLRSRYARRIMQSEPDLADAFETRRLRAA